MADTEVQTVAVDDESIARRTMPQLQPFLTSEVDEADGSRRNYKQSAEHQEILRFIGKQSSIGTNTNSKRNFR